MKTSLPTVSFPFRIVASLTALFTFFLIVVGALVRVSGSGLGCPDWPLCHGQLIPPFEFHTLVEYSHRLSATLVTLFTLSTALWAWLRYRAHKWILRGALLAVVLLIVQILLGGITVLTELPPTVVAIHLGNAMLLLATALTVATLAWRTPSAVSLDVDNRSLSPIQKGGYDQPLFKLILASAAGVFIIIISGSLVEGSGAAEACKSWPLCNGGEVISSGTLALIHMLHRFIVGVAGLLALYTFYRAMRVRAQNSSIFAVGLIGAIALIVQVFVGAAQVWLQFPPFVEGTHVALASAVWGSLVVLAHLVRPLVHQHALGPALGVHKGADLSLYPAPTSLGDSHQATPQPPAPGPAFGVRGTAPRDVPFHFGAPLETARKSEAEGNSETRGKPVRVTVADYFALTKPWIAALLLTTTVAGMFVAARGMPPLNILILTLVGGACAAGGANALNSYIDRDLDKIMGRTSRRPLPSGRVSPRGALIFALTLSTLSPIILGLGVNWLSAGLAVLGIVYYAGLYTLVLKRATPQNIVVGGAAGAIPPLVGWAAVSNDVSLLALYLFAIILLWTPPHTWALMLLLDKDYHRAKIPMLPAAWGQVEARRQIILYSILLFVTTLVPFSIGALGFFYFLGAVILGVYFLLLALRLWRNGETYKPIARKLYHFSNAYLALLFLAMVVDHWLPTWRV